MIRLLVILIFCSILVILSTACGGYFNELSPTSPFAGQTLSPRPSSTHIVLPSLTQSTPTWTLEPPITITSEPATSTPMSSLTPAQPENESNPAQFPNPEAYEWRLILHGLNQPVGIANAGDGSGRLFVVEQSGQIRIIREDNLLAEPFLDISNQVSCCGESGLLGLAFHPQYAQNGFFFVNYTDFSGDTVISRFQVSEEVDRANLSSEIKLLSVEQPFRNHNGGSLAFGPEGYLYIGLGDGGSAGDPSGNAQNTDSLLGKILRLDVDQGEPYTIPADNPFVSGGGAPEIWITGLRNPWRFSFDRLTGDLFIGDVGQGSWEEIDFLSAGSSGGVNFGWNFREGANAYSSSEPSGDLVLTDPVAEYGRDQGFSVIGGMVYRGAELPEWQGIYLYGDYGSGFIWGLFQASDDSWQNSLLFQTDSRITSFGENENGELYFTDYNGGLYKLENR